MNDTIKQAIFVLLIAPLLFSLSAIPTQANNPSMAFLSGKILLQVEDRGEAWYVNPANLKRYYLGQKMLLML